MSTLMMAGHDRTYAPPLALRGETAPRLSAWDLLYLQGAAQDWAASTVESVLAAAAAPAVECMGDCADTGFYGVPDVADPDMLVHLVRRAGDDFQQLTASGAWIPAPGSMAVEVLSLDIAHDLAEAITAGACGLVRRYFQPRAFLPPVNVACAAGDRQAVLTAATNAEGGEQANLTGEPGFIPYAMVDPLDVGAVLELLRIGPGPVVQRYEQGQWVEDGDILANLVGIQPPPIVELTATTYPSVLGQVDQSEAPVEATTAAVSPDPRAEKLRRYWTTGKGAAKIRWGTPGDWTRCFRQLRKHMGERARGYCQNLHKRATGVYTGSRLNAAAPPIEAALAASLVAGHWTGSDGRTTMTATTLPDGIYTQAPPEEPIVAALLAGAFPVNPPDEWFEDPMLAGATPLTVTDEGRVFGHIASWNTRHIGLPGDVRPPRSPSNYAMFRTGQLVTASGATVNVGQLTLAGGHAPIRADAQRAVEHYDSTGSAAADVAAGEDRYGIWVAGAIRPDLDPPKLRALRASAPSGDWRPINGRLELVAVCQVNVPGFPVARVASGAVEALVAAGAMAVLEEHAADVSRDQTSLAAVVARLAVVEGILASLSPEATATLTGDQAQGELVDGAAINDALAADPAVAETPAVAEQAPAAEVAPDPQAEKIAAARTLSRQRRRESLRARAHRTTAPVAAATTSA